MAVQRGRVLELDGIRGLAILLVVFFHYLVCASHFVEGTLPYVLIKLFAMGWSGVDLFFVLSGFLIGGILLDNQASENYFSVFYLRRACRIFPIYGLLLGLYAVLKVTRWISYVPNTAWLFDPPLPLWAYFLYLQNFFMAAADRFGAKALPMSWSLAVEEQFYLCLPFLIRYLPRRRLPWVLGALILSAPLMRIAIVTGHPFSLGKLAAYVLLPCRWDSLFLGVLGAYAFRQERLKNLLRGQENVLWGVFAMFAAGAFLLMKMSRGFMSIPQIYFGYTWLALFYAWFILLALWSSNRPLKSFLSSALLRQFGTISYAIYLFHTIVNGVLHGAFFGREPSVSNWQEFAVTAAAFLLTIGTAKISWIFFESRVVAWGHRAKYLPVPVTDGVVITKDRSHEIFFA